MSWCPLNGSVIPAEVNDVLRMLSELKGRITFEKSQVRSLVELVNETERHILSVSQSFLLLLLQIVVIQLLFVYD